MSDYRILNNDPSYENELARRKYGSDMFVAKIFFYATCILIFLFHMVARNLLMGGRRALRGNMGLQAASCGLREEYVRVVDESRGLPGDFHGNMSRRKPDDTSPLVLLFV
jgi:hypothetical protein